MPQHPWLVFLAKLAEFGIDTFRLTETELTRQALLARIHLQCLAVPISSPDRAAQLLRILCTGTLGILLDAKKAGMVTSITPMLDHLDSLRFRLSIEKRAAVHRLAAESGRAFFSMK